MEMNGRGFHGDYRFGYQGSEKDNEVSGDGNSYTTEFRQLDPRLGRWFSVDPVFQPWQSPYTSMNNDPINLNDPMGDTPPGAAEEIVVDNDQNPKVDPAGNTHVFGPEVTKVRMTTTEETVVNHSDGTTTIKVPEGTVTGYWKGDVFYNSYYKKDENGEWQFAGYAPEKTSAATVDAFENNYFIGGVPEKYQSGGFSDQVAADKVECIPCAEKADDSENAPMEYFGTVNDISLAAAMTYNALSNDSKRKFAYNLSKRIDVKSGKIFQSLKGFGEGSAKFLGKAATGIAVASIIYDFGTGTANTATVVDGLMVAGGVAAIAAVGIAAAPYVLAAGAVYGIASLFGFDDYINEKFDISESINFIKKK